MGYTLGAYVARKEVFETLGVESVPLTGGFHLTTRRIEDDALEKHEIAFLMASFFGGCGEQESTVYGPAGMKSFGPSYDAINQALVLLGVVRSDSMDEFDTLGLGRHRDNDWMPEEDPWAEMEN